VQQQHGRRPASAATKPDCVPALNLASLKAGLADAAGERRHLRGSCIGLGMRMRMPPPPLQSPLPCRRAWVVSPWLPHGLTHWCGRGCCVLQALSTLLSWMSRS
jgi:hypothetical protein